mgnify:CR=1 FL=1
MSKHVLITGPDGFIGSHCVEHILANTDWTITCSASWRHDGVPERLADSEYVRSNWSRLSFITHDLTSPFSMVAIGRMPPVDYIVHFASDSNVDRSITNPVEVVRNNVLVTLNVMELARELEPDAVIQISTDEVYGPAKDGYLHKEWDPIIPSNPYAASKASQEAIATSYWRTYGVPVIITNTMNNIGERQSCDKFLPLVIRSVLDGKCVNIHSCNGVIGSRFYLHARNHADACVHLLSNPVSSYDAPGRVGPYSDRPDKWNVVGDVEIDNLSLAQSVADIVGRPLVYDLVDAHSSRPGHDLRYALDGGKIASTGWTAPVSFDRSLEKTVKWFIDNPEWLSV